MKLYEKTDVEMSYQNFGSSWLGILKGPTEQIKQVFNGLFNLCGTHGDVQFKDHLEMVGTFWTDRKAMRRFFFNRFYIPRTTENEKANRKLVRKAMRYALDQLNGLRETSHEFYLKFSDKFVPETYCCGDICAERPDTDMKDAILEHAFRDKDITGKRVELDTDENIV